MHGKVLHIITWTPLPSIASMANSFYEILYLHTLKINRLKIKQ